MLQFRPKVGGNRALQVSGRFVEPGDGLLVAHDDVECFWTSATDFGGWQGGPAGATAYNEYLDRLGL